MIRAIAVIFALSSSAANAQSAGAQAEVLFRQGRDLMAAGKLTEACTAFEESQHLEPAVTTLLNLAGCREKRGELATAWGLFLEAARQTRSATDAANQQLHGVAQDRARKLEPRVSRLTINVPPGSQVDGLEITRGTERVAAGSWNRALPIDGGTYTITASAPGATRWSTQVTVSAENDHETVEIPALRDLPREVDDARRNLESPPPPVAAMPGADTPVSPRASKTAPFVVGAGAVALLGAGLGFELSSRSRYDAAEAETTTQRRRDSLYDSANTRHYLAQAFALSGLATGGVAVWLYLRARDREHRDAAHASVHVVPIPTGLAVSGRF